MSKVMVNSAAVLQRCWEERDGQETSLLAQRRWPLQTGSVRIQQKTWFEDSRGDMLGSVRTEDGEESVAFFAS